METWFRYGSENLRNCRSWQTACIGGEPAKPSVIQCFRNLGRRDLRLFNLYGPTEVSVAAFKGEVFYNDEQMDLSLPGQLLPNYKAYIVDEELNPVPVGVPGEILLGGPAIALGYLGLETETTAKFIHDPIDRSNDHSGSVRIYRTGDRGRFLEDGSLICEGRLDGDSQVKIRGVRVELGEVEGVIIQEAAGAISQAIATVKDDILVAYVLFSSERHRDDNDVLLGKLQRNLPMALYMCPSFIFRIEELPLTSHGKVDRKAINSLPLPETIHLSTSVEATPLSATEMKLAGLWRRVLPRDVAGVQPSTDFFKIGGNSLLLVKLQFLIKQEMDMALPLIELMNRTELAKMSNLIDGDKLTKNIDWDAEIDMSPFYRLSAANNRPIKKHDGLRVILTGATGQLGRRILKQMASNASVSDITCLVRESSASLHHEMFSSLRNVQLIHVDLEQADLGLSKDLYDELSENTDAIIHCAANRSFWDSYEVVRPVNVEAAKTLAHMATRNHAHIHLLSSGAVSSFEMSDNDPLPRPPLDGSDGYVASKWAIERFFMGASRVGGFPVTVHRPTVATSDGRIDVDTNTVIDELLGVARQLGSRPDFTGVRGKVYLAPVDNIASDIISRLTQTTAPGEVEVVEHAATLQADVEEFIQNDVGIRDLPMMPALHWIGEAKKAGFTHMFTAHNLVMSDSNGRSIISRR